MKPIPLGHHFLLSEFERSARAIELGVDNTAPPDAIERLRALVTSVLDPLRRHLKKPVRITSGYRSAALNAAIGGYAQSQHMRGEAADIKVDGMGAESLALAILDVAPEFDQLIWYDPARGGHVHVSYRVGARNRLQKLWAPTGGGYVSWSR